MGGTLKCCSTHLSKGEIPKTNSGYYIIQLVQNLLISLHSTVNTLVELVKA